MHWYFDFISPYAYLQSTRLQEFEAQESVKCVPVLFAGLLQHWGNLGPAEIAPKRTWTFQHVIWLAHRDAIKLTLPAHHPFNPLPLLRLSIALDNKIEVVQRLFSFVWVDGFVPKNETAFAALLHELNCTVSDLNTDKVKLALRFNGEQAIDKGVFGVPSIVRNEQLFWGYDATDMAHAHYHAQQSLQTSALTNKDIWPAEQLNAVHHFPQGTSRKRID